MSEVINVHEAKTHLSRLLDRVREGEELILGKAGKPYARLVPINDIPPGRKFGVLKDRLKVPDSFFDPLPEEELRAWEGEEDDDVLT